MNICGLAADTSPHLKVVLKYYIHSTFGRCLCEAIGESEGCSCPVCTDGVGSLRRQCRGLRPGRRRVRHVGVRCSQSSWPGTGLKAKCRHFQNGAGPAVVIPPASGGDIDAFHRALPGTRCGPRHRRSDQPEVSPRQDPCVVGTAGRAAPARTQRTADPTAKAGCVQTDLY